MANQDTTVGTSTHAGSARKRRPEHSQLSQQNNPHESWPPQTVRLRGQENAADLLPLDSVVSATGQLVWLPDSPSVTSPSGRWDPAVSILVAATAARLYALTGRIQ